MDKLDISIMQELQEDARKPYTDIAKILGVAESTVRNRVSRLGSVASCTDVRFTNLGLS